MMTRRPRLLKIPDIVLQPGEQLIRLTWPAGMRRLRPRSKWAVRVHRVSYRAGSEHQYDYKYIWKWCGVRSTGWNRYTPGNRWRLARSIAEGTVSVYVCWQAPYAVSSGL